ncbi:hypothetical protein BKA70DRAFT_1419405 [Coprinopsis sp. MPI-PUGE-AT-0042]|nr:hypothetical protein BKA70DRAFT_1419405 [Coprinopsis sp. MPI-PUGE-AT-0042]
MTWAQRKKRIKDDPLYRVGQHVARYLAPFTDLERLHKNEDKMAGYLAQEGLQWRELEDEHRVSHPIYLEILRLLDKSGNNWTGASRANKDNIIKFLKSGQHGALNQDQKMLETTLWAWLGLVNPGVDKPGSRTIIKGFCAKSVVGAFLCPVTLDWSRSEVKQLLASRRQPLTLEERPRILYQGLEYDATNPWDGFLQNQVLVKAFKAVYAPSRLSAHYGNRGAGVKVECLCYVTFLVRGLSFLQQFYQQTY